MRVPARTHWGLQNFSRSLAESHLPSQAALSQMELAFLSSASTGPASPPDLALQNKSLLLCSHWGLACTSAHYCPDPSRLNWGVQKPPSFLCSLLISGNLKFDSSSFLRAYWVERWGTGNPLPYWPIWLCRWYLPVVLHNQFNSTLFGPGCFVLSFIMTYNSEHEASAELLA